MVRRLDKYKLNYLRWLTRGKLPDEILETIEDVKLKDDKLSFACKIPINPKKWRYWEGEAI